VPRDPHDGLDEPQETDVVVAARAPKPEKLRLIVTAGPDKDRGIDLVVGTYVVGKLASCELPLTDTQVSRQHLELSVRADGVQVRDLGSTNGSWYNGARFDTIVVGLGAQLTIGGTELRLVGPPVAESIPASTADRFGELVGASTAMRQVFALLERVAPTDAVVLVQGETGSGKELVAEGIHARSHRKRGPFVVCDLGSLPRSLIESELFGHLRGSFTGADRDREGAFPQADGGTIFLDEIGELEPDVQPRLLRALERGQVKPVGSAQFKNVNVRVIAATNRDLAAEVKAGRFREDLYHRLAVVKVELPPLRDRMGDVALLVRHFLDQAAAGSGRAPVAVAPETMQALAAHDWPGNVRQLKNVIDRALALAPHAEVLDPVLLGLEELSTPRASTASNVAAPATLVDPSIQFKEAKESLVQAWEREYVAALLDKAGGNVSLAARRAGIDRVYLHRLMKKHGIGGS
jgi:DNA-binding NtrC family response regulator